MGDYKYLFLLIFLVLPLLQWIFKKLFQVTQAANRYALEREQHERQQMPETPTDRDDGFEEVVFEEPDHGDDGEWEIIEEPPPPPVARVRPVQARVAPQRIPERTTAGGEIARFLEDLAGEARARQAPRPGATPPPLTTAAVTTRPRPVVPSTPSLAPSRALAPLPVPVGSLGLPRWAGERRRSGTGMDLSASRLDLRRMIVWSELLSPPVALRDEPPGSRV